MITIGKAKITDSVLLAEIGKLSFVESHGSSASAADINSYVNEKYTDEVVSNDIATPGNIYHLIYYNERPAGYSKIILNVVSPNIPLPHVTKMERLYLLKEFYDLKLGQELLNFNIRLSQEKEQAGMWLFVWTENHRAVNFYKKNGFKIVSSHDFKLTDTHSNPNYQMFLQY